MTREEALEILNGYKLWIAKECELREAVDMAIEALHHVEAEEKGYCHRINYIPKPCEDANCDCVEVVRCKDCRYWEYEKPKGACIRHTEDTLGYAISTGWDDFCSYGERREP